MSFQEYLKRRQSELYNAYDNLTKKLCFEEFENDPLSLVSTIAAGTSMENPNRNKILEFFASKKGLEAIETCKENLKEILGEKNGEASYNNLIETRKQFIEEINNMNKDFVNSLFVDNEKDNNKDFINHFNL